MENKIAIGIVLAILLVVIVAFSGCIEEYSGYIEEETPTKAPEVTTPPATDKEEEIEEVYINGNYNAVYYPKEARPIIKENGFGNEIKTY